MSDVYQGASPNARFLAGAVPASETSWQSYGQRAAGSMLTHAAVLFVIVFLLTRIPDKASIPVAEKPPDITWLKIPGPGGGGGGGGNERPEPPRKAEIVPPKARKIEPPPKVEV